AVAAPRAAQRLTAVALLAVGPLTWGLLLSMGLVCTRGSSGLVRHGSVRRGPAGRSSPEASQRCAAGAGLDGAGQDQALLVPSEPHAIPLCHPIPCHKPAPASRSQGPSPFRHAAARPHHLTSGRRVSRPQP